MDTLLENIRQLYVETQQANIDESRLGKPIEFTCSKNKPLTFNQWKDLLVPEYLSKDEFERYMSFRNTSLFGVGKTITNAVTVYAVTGDDPPETVMFSSANWRGPYSGGLSDEPLHLKWFIIFHAEENGQILRDDQATNISVIGSGGMHNYLPLK